jgi:glycosyltransferase involved in cell wall biosynthesis
MTKIGFVLLSNRRAPIASTRISVLNMLPYLERAGFEVHILFEPDISVPEPDVSSVAARALELNINVVYFQKVKGQSVLDTIAHLSKEGVRTVYGVCDLVEDEVADASDLTIVVTDYLKNLYEPRLHDKIVVVHDGIERPEFQITEYRGHYASSNNPIIATLVTSADLRRIPHLEKIPKFVQTWIVGRYPPTPFLQSVRQHLWRISAFPHRSDRIEYLRSLLHSDFRLINWDPEAVYQIMLQSDVGIIPVEMGDDPLPRRTVSWWQVKSENRLTMKMALGLPVIASPVPSYTDLVSQGENGFLASNTTEWVECLEVLRDPRLRAEIGRNARRSVIERFSKEEQASKLIRALQRLMH